MFKFEPDGGPRRCCYRGRVLLSKWIVIGWHLEESPEDPTEGNEVDLVSQTGFDSSFPLFPSVEIGIIFAVHPEQNLNHGFHGSARIEKSVDLRFKKSRKGDKKMGDKNMVLFLIFLSSFSCLSRRISMEQGALCFFLSVSSVVNSFEGS